VAQSHPEHSHDDPIDRLVRQVIDIFDPASFTVTFFTAHVPDQRRHQRMIRSMSQKLGYKRTDRILYEFDGYDLVYGHYIKTGLK
jgi:S-adenosylmethionine decarboxylase